MAQVIRCLAGTNCDKVFYFMPAFNPDGYEYSRNSKRFWRKNRSTPTTTSGCSGTDLNRNWSYYWGFAGSSSYTCSVVYRGPMAFSAPETTAGKNALNSILANSDIDLKLFISYHSYSQLVLYPWGHGDPVFLPNKEEHIEGAKLYHDTVLSVHGKSYVAQNSADLYPASGTDHDYAKSLGIFLSYTIELRDTGDYGFDLPASQIIETFEENWAAFKDLVMFSAGTTKTLLSSCKI